MPTKITLGELVDLSIGTPEIGAVNFNALHTLLVAMLKHLSLQDVKTELPPQVTEQSRSIESIRASVSATPSKEKRRVSVSRQPSGTRPPPHVMEAQMKDLGGQVQDLGKQVQAIGSQVQGIESHVQDIGSQVDVFGEQIAALDKLPSGTDLLEKTPSGSRVSDMWQMMQVKKKVEANEDGISKAMGLIQDVMNEVKDLKADQKKGQLQKEVPQELKDYKSVIADMEERIADLEKLVNNQENNLEVVSRKMSSYPEDNSIVTWEDLEQALVSGRRSSLPEDRLLAPETSLATEDILPDKASQVSKKISLQKMPAGTEGPPIPQEAARLRQISTEQHAPLPFITPQQFPLTLVSRTPPSTPPGSSQFLPVAPGIGQGAPGIGQSPPGVGQTHPGVGQPAPGVGQPAPGVGPPPPGVGLPPLGVGQPHPGVVQPYHGVGQPPPGVGQPSPGIGQPPPGVVQVAPGVGQPPPGVVQVAPGVGQPPPGVVQVAPGVGQPPPEVVQVAPGAGQPFPGVGQPPPRVGQVAPGVGQVAPGVGQPPPRVSQVAPGVGQPPPGVGQPPPRVGQPPPGVGQPPRGVGQPPPGVGQPPRGGGQPPPGVGQPPPRVGQPHRGVGQSPPGVGQPPPGVVQPHRGVGQPPPRVGQTPPGVGQTPPGVGQVAPVVAQTYPRVGQTYPGVGQTYPGVGQIYPGVGQTHPGVGQPFPLAPGIGQPDTAISGTDQVSTAISPGQPVLGTPATYQPVPGAVPTYPSVPGAPSTYLLVPGTLPTPQPVTGTPPTYQPGPSTPVAYPGAPFAYPAYHGAPGTYPGTPGTYPGTPGTYQPEPRTPPTHPQVPGAPPTTQPEPGAPPTHPQIPETPHTTQPEPEVPPTYLQVPGSLPIYPPVPGAPPPYLPHPGAPGVDQPIPIDPVTGRPMFVAPGTDLPSYEALFTYVPEPGAPPMYQPFPGVPETGSLGPMAPTGAPDQGVPPSPQQLASGIPGTHQPGFIVPSTAPSTMLGTIPGIIPEGEQLLDQAATQAELPSDAQPDFVPPHPSYFSRQPSFMAAYPPYMPPQPPQPQFPWYSALSYRPKLSPRDKGSERESFSFPFALETLRLMGELTNYYLILKEQIGALDEDAGHSELEKLQFLIGKLTSKTIPEDMLEQLRGLKALTKEIQEEREKMKLMQRILQGEEEDAEEERERSGHLSLQLSILRVNVNDIEKELALLRERQEQGKAIVEQSVTEATLYLQEQLDKLRMIIESMLTSSSTLLSMSMVPAKTPAPFEPSQVDPHATCPACSLDLSQQVSKLVQRYEQLQDLVNNLMVSRPSRKYQQQNQDEELLGHIQATILQVQGDCEKLNITTGNLLEDHRQKQKDIDVLYQSLEKLEKEKANREHLELEIDVKADKTSLAAKVSRIQFDATTEQLNQMMQDLLTKVTGQEKDWKKVLDKLLVEMDTKLDRLELDPLKKMLEEKWKALRKQLKEQSPLYQSDEAAIMRRQLLAHFHCLSCDRPLETAVPGPIIPSVPSGPGLPAHRSNRPYTIYELEQVRQQSRNMRLGTAFQRMELGQLERSVSRLHSMHTKMLMDIEKVQIHFGGSVKASSKMIRELLQAQCLNSSYYKRIQDMPDYSYMSVPRRCGGSHTLTFPYRRYARLQHLAQCIYPTEDVQSSLKHEVDILGLDGHIYKGRLETRLPGIPSKESPVKNKPKNLSTIGQNRQSPSRPQSAQMMVASMTTQQTKGRPVSSQGRLTQLNATHPPSPTTITPANFP